MFRNANDKRISISTEDARNIKKNIVSLGIIIVLILLPAILLGKVLDITSPKLWYQLLIAIATVSTILLYTNFKLSSDSKKAELRWENIFFYSFALGCISLVLGLLIYFPAMISLVFFWSIWLGSWISGGIHAMDQNRD